MGACVWCVCVVTTHNPISMMMRYKLNPYILGSIIYIRYIEISTELEYPYVPTSLFS